jgi:hypothetical protein
MITDLMISLKIYEFRNNVLVFPSQCALRNVRYSRRRRSQARIEDNVYCTFTDWLEYPQIYVKGQLIGGLDILKVKSMAKLSTTTIM